VVLFLADAGMAERPKWRETPQKSMPRVERRALAQAKGTADAEAAAAEAGKPGEGGKPPVKESKPAAKEAKPAAEAPAGDAGKAEAKA
jgi:hypothetical protein